MAGGDLGLHVPHHQIGGADVVSEQLPERFVLHAPVVRLERQELQALGVGVLGVHDPAAAGCQRADVQVVRGGDREAHKLVPEENRDAEGHIGPVRGPVVGRVVDDHVTRMEPLAACLEEGEDAANVAWYRPELQRRGEGRLAQLPPLRVEQRATEVLRLADDARIGHPGQLVPHLDRDALQGTSDHPRGDRIDPGAYRRGRNARCGHLYSSLGLRCGSAAGCRWGPRGRTMLGAAP